MDLHASAAGDTDAPEAASGAGQGAAEPPRQSRRRTGTAAWRRRFAGIGRVQVVAAARIVSSAAFAALFGGLLVGMAAPRLIADLIVFPHGDAIARLSNDRKVSTAELAGAARALDRSLALHKAGDRWAMLGAIHLERARRLDILERGHQVFLDRAIRSFERGLAVAPAQPFAWTMLAQAMAARDGISPALGPVLRMAVATAEHSPRLIMIRIELGLLAWEVLDEATRAAIAAQVKLAVDRVPAELAKMVRGKLLLGPARQALANDPTRLRRFDSAYLAGD